MSAVYFKQQPKKSHLSHSITVWQNYRVASLLLQISNLLVDDSCGMFIDAKDSDWVPNQKYESDLGILRDKTMYIKLIYTYPMTMNKITSSEDWNYWLKTLDTASLNHQIKIQWKYPKTIKRKGQHMFKKAFQDIKYGGNGYRIYVNIMTGENVVNLGC